MHLEHPPPFGPSWHANWIWWRRPRIRTETATRPVLDNPTDEIALFRRSLHLSHVPPVVPARVWVDGRYRLTVNGIEAARGPVRSDPRAGRYDVVDLAPLLREGDNVIGVTCRHFADATSWWMPVPPSYSLGGGSMVFEALVGDAWVVSDRQWRCQRGVAWTPVPIPGDVACLPLESFDARHHPDGWDRPGFPDSEWEAAVEITALHTGAHGVSSPPTEPFGMLRPPVRRHFPGGARHDAKATGRRIVPDGETVEDPVRQVLADETTAVDDNATGHTEVVSFDVGCVAAGTVLLNLDNALVGTVVDVAVAEHLDAEGRLVTLGQHAGLRYVAGGHPDEKFESFDVLGFRYAHVSLRPPPGAPTPEVRLSVQDRHRPRPAGTSFSCSDPVLNKIYEVGLRTVDLCALDAYVDCPTREQRAWTGDSVVHQMVDLVANPDWSMAIWHPQLATMSRSDGMLAMAVASDFAADDRSFVPDWSLHWVRSVHNLYRYVGDPEVVADLLPVAERVLRWFESYLGTDGLLHDVTGWVLLDWSSVYSQGCSSTLTALWARALEDFADMASWLGNDGAARWARRRWAAVREGFEVFWDEERGVYVDHVVGGVPQRPAAQHGGAAALAAGLVPEGRIDRVVAGITDRSRLIRHSWVMDPVTPEGDSSGYVHLVTGYPAPTWDTETQMVEAQPFFRYVVHDALDRAGHASLIAGMCRDWEVFLNAGESTWPECWQGGTRCHGWSATPSRDLVTRVVGITPAEPGYASVRVAPQLGDLEWARAVVPSPHGPITVEAHADGSVHVDSPVPVVEA